MAIDLKKYPLAWRAVEEMKASYAGDEEGPGYKNGLAITERALEILDTYLDAPAQDKENLMAVTALLRRKGTVFGMDTTGIEQNYNPRVLSLVIEVQQGINEGKNGGATKDILQVATATQIATHEMMITWAAPESALMWREPLKKYREFRDRSVYADLADTRLQKLEVKIYNDLMATLDELGGASSPGFSKPADAEPKVLH